MNQIAGHTLVIGTRGSLLARSQTDWVAQRLRENHPDLDVRIKIITTTGDRLQDQPLPEIGGKGIFTEQLEAALLDGSIDLAVHSAKDLPTELRDGLDILAVPIREDPRDAWIAGDGRPFDEIAPGSTVGTTSLRRQAQLLMRRKGLMFVGLRGNVDTRIRKVQRGDCAGAVLAMAGLKRAGLERHVTHPFEPDIMLPAPGQGALALEGRADDERVRACLSALHDEQAALELHTERAILAELDAGCRAPVAIYATTEGNHLRCQALVVDPKGERQVRAAADAPVAQSQGVIEGIVAELRSGGAEEIISSCRTDGPTS